MMAEPPPSGRNSWALKSRSTRSSTHDAVSAGKLDEAMKAAIEQLDSYIGANPNAPQTADAFVKLGHCHARLAALIVQPQEQQKELAAARQAYEQVLNRFQKHEAYPQAVFERAKVMAQQRDINGAMNELRRFTGDPLKKAVVAPMAQLHLATLLRGQNKAQDAAGFSNAVEDSLGDYQAMMHMPGNEMRMQGERRLLSVDLAVKGKRGERFGL